MAIVVEAVYEGGVLKLKQPLPLQEHAKVQVTIEPQLTCAELTAGIMGFTGTAEEADYFALDPELDYPPPPEEP